MIGRWHEKARGVPPPGLQTSSSASSRSLLPVVAGETPAIRPAEVRSAKPHRSSFGQALPPPAPSASLQSCPSVTPLAGEPPAPPSPPLGFVSPEPLFERPDRRSTGLQTSSSVLSRPLRSSSRPRRLLPPGRYAFSIASACCRRRDACYPAGRSSFGQIASKFVRPGPPSPAPSASLQSHPSVTPLAGEPQAGSP